MLSTDADSAARIKGAEETKEERETSPLFYSITRAELQKSLTNKTVSDIVTIQTVIIKITDRTWLDN